MRFGIDRIRASDAALFRAGRAWMEYKGRNKGEFKKGVLPDYMIGAIAECEQIPLMTTNPGDYTSYFPDVPLIHPAPGEMKSSQAQIADQKETHGDLSGLFDDLLGGG